MVSETNQEMPLKITIFGRFGQQWVFWRFFLIFSESVLCKELGFLTCRPGVAGAVLQTPL